MAVLLGLPVAMAACAAGDEAEVTSSQHAVGSRGDTVVSLELARAAAEAYDLTEGAPARHVRSHSMLAGSDQRPAMYAFNFEEGGFVIVSAELELAPILAFADAGTIDLARLPDGPSLWAEDMREGIEAVRRRGPADSAERTRQVDADRAEREQWQPLLDTIAARGDRPISDAELEHARAVTDPDICYTCEHPEPLPACTTYATASQKGPLLTTFWAQGCGFNGMTPASGSYDLCYHMLTGCTATALGQMVNYWQHASGHTYNWSQMGSGIPGTYVNSGQRAQLLSDLGVASSTTYGTTESTASTANAEVAMQQYGYTTSRASISNGTALSATALHTELNAGRPVLLRGSNGSGGHIWVVDGVKLKKGGPVPCKSSSTAGYYYHFNWGWGYGTDAWYKEGASGSYKLSRQYITAKPH